MRATLLLIEFLGLVQGLVPMKRVSLDVTSSVGFTSLSTTSSSTVTTETSETTTTTSLDTDIEISTDVSTDISSSVISEETTLVVITTTSSDSPESTSSSNTSTSVNTSFEDSATPSFQTTSTDGSISDATLTTTDISSTDTEVSTSTGTFTEMSSTETSSTAASVTETGYSSAGTEISSTGPFPTETELPSTQTSSSTFSTGDLTTGTETLPTEIGFSSTGSGIASNETVISSTETGVSSSGTEILSTSVEITSTAVDISSTTTEASVTGTDGSRTSTEASTESLSSDATPIVTSTPGVSIPPETVITSEPFSIPGADTTFPIYTPPTKTVEAGPEATSEAVKIGPLFLALWKDRGLLENPESKQRFIDQVRKTKDSVIALAASLPDKPPAPPGPCGSTSGSGSLLSGIVNLLETPAKLIGCAAQVVSNLVLAVESVVVPIPVVTLLTDTLKDINTELDKHDKDDNDDDDDGDHSTEKQTESPTRSATSSASSSESACTTQTVGQCVERVQVYTSFYVVASESTSSTSSTVVSRTTTVCETVARCDATPTTAHTTVFSTAASTTSAAPSNICGLGCTGSGCSVSNRLRRRIEKESRKPSRVGFKKRSLQFLARIKDINKYVIDQLTASRSGELDWRKGHAVSASFDFMNRGFVKWIAGINGCTAIVIISEKGMWHSHFMEPGFIGGSDLFEEHWKGIKSTIASGKEGAYIKPTDLTGEGGVLSGGNIQVLVSAPRKPESSQDAPEWVYERTDELLSLVVGSSFAGATVTKRGYLKQEASEFDENADTTAFGKVLVQYDPNQRKEDFTAYSPKKAMSRVWLEHTPYEHLWDASRCQGGNPPAARKRQEGSCPIDPSPSEPAPPSDTGPTGSESPSTVTSTTRNGTATASITESASATSKGSSTGSVSDSKSASSTRSGSNNGTASATTSASASPSSTRPPRVAAPDITITTPTETPDCVQGYSTHTMPAVASAPANAASLKFLIPEADRPATDWEFEILPGFAADPKEAVRSWRVGSSANGPPIASGDGGKAMGSIKWKAPLGIKGTYVQLEFADPSPPLGRQTYGVVARGSVACMPKACSGPPRVVTDADGNVCRLYPCSTQPACEAGGPITPKAECLMVQDGLAVPLWWYVSIAANGWVADGGAKLKEEEGGCGGLLSWSPRKINVKSPDQTWTASMEMSFTLPLTIKSGCVERAIASAGGPSGMKCVKEKSEWVF